MKGNNTLVLCQSEMNNAIEYYLNEVVFKEPVLVDKVTYKGDFGANEYRVDFEECCEDPEKCEESCGTT